MGWFTNKDKNWEFTNLWFIPLSIVLPVFLPLAFVYVGYRAKKIGWLLLSPVYLVLMAWLLSRPEITTLVFIALLVIWLSGIGILLLIRREYLQRLDISTRQPLAWNKKYNYIFLDEDGNPVGAASQFLPPSQLFMANLKYWRKEIQNAEIHENIDRMLEISTIIHDKDSGASDIFFARHADTVNKMLRQYDEIENSNLDSPVMRETKERIIAVIETARKAFEQELANMFKSDILDMGAESDAYLQNLRNRGLIE